ncbi:MAG TPA: hypothetical protein VMT76_13920 [Puia sp.]|nr:hypothetical protein [Puia sp.]
MKKQPSQLAVITLIIAVLAINKFISGIESHKTWKIIFGAAGLVFCLVSVFLLIKSKKSEDKNPSA